MPRSLTRSDLEQMFAQVKNWGRWGADDERGALNFITPAKRAEAAAGIQDGSVVSCALDFPVEPGPDNPHPALHMMNSAGDICTGAGPDAFQSTTDFIGISFHGLASSHIDALCHVLVDEQMYNGFHASEVKSTGAVRGSIMAARDGIASRGVLLDIPRSRGTDWLEPGDPISIEDLEAAEKHHAVRVEEGDVLLVATGRHARRAAKGDWNAMSEGLAGLHPECVPWLHERRIAVLGSDGISDVVPGPGIQGWFVPIHQCGIVGIGLHLLDNLDLSALSRACAERERYAFFFVVAPLRVEGGTGSPVNPIAIF